MESSFSDLLTKLQGEKDWHRSAIFTDAGETIATNKATLLPDEIKYAFHSYSPRLFIHNILFIRFYIQAYNDRDTTVGEGFFINNEHFDVHRFHPPLVYGRRGGPDDGEGIGLCRVKPKNQKGDEIYWFLLITYLLPILSAKAVPQMVKFAETHRNYIMLIVII